MLVIAQNLFCKYKHCICTYVPTYNDSQVEQGWPSYFSIQSQSIWMTARNAINVTVINHKSNNDSILKFKFKIVRRKKIQNDMHFYWKQKSLSIAK